MRRTCNLKNEGINEQTTDAKYPSTTRSIVHEIDQHASFLELEIGGLVSHRQCSPSQSYSSRCSWRCISWHTNRCSEQGFAKTDSRNHCAVRRLMDAFLLATMPTHTRTIRWSGTFMGYVIHQRSRSLIFLRSSTHAAECVHHPSPYSLKTWSIDTGAKYHSCSMRAMTSGYPGHVNVLDTSIPSSRGRPLQINQYSAHPYGFADLFWKNIKRNRVENDSTKGEDDMSGEDWFILLICILTLETWQFCAFFALMFSYHRV